MASPGVEQPVPQLQHSEGATPTSDMEGPNPPPGPQGAIAASKTLRHAKDGSGEWIPSDRGGGRKDLNFRAFFPTVFLGWKRVEREKKKKARDRMPSISSLRCCKGILCTGLRGQSLAELHWTLVVKNSLFKLGTSSTQPSWLLPKGRHHHSAKSWVVEAALLQIGPMYWPQMDAL